MRWVFGALLLVIGCGDDGGAPDAAAPDAEPPHCPVFGVTVGGDPFPGGSLTLAVSDDGSAPFTLQWSVTAGTMTPGDPATWTFPEDFGALAPEAASWTLTVGGAGCTPFSGDVTVGWPDRLRVVVIYNPAAAGSEDAARHYATGRGIPEDHLCAVSASDPTSIPAAEFDAFVDDVVACADAVGPQALYLAPVFGVPYKVQGRIDDIATPGAKVETSLDALLVYGAAAKDLGMYTVNAAYQGGDSLNGLYDPYEPFPALREDLGVYFLVTRLDGADAAAAMAVADRALEGEQLGCDLAGTVYVDGRMGVPHPVTDAFGSYEGGEWNIIGVENVFQGAGYPIVANYDDAEFGTAPAPLTAPDALFYAGWYSFANYNDAFTWSPGAVGGHLDSCSACDLRGTRDWSAMALRRGITATFGAVNEPYVAGMPEYDQFFLYLLQGASFAEAAYESTILGAWMMVWVGDPLYRPFAGGCP